MYFICSKNKKDIIKFKKMLFDKIKKKKIKVGVIGLGYVGLPRAIQFCNKNIQVYGIDNDFKKVEILNKGRSYITNLKKKDIQKISKKNFLFHQTIFQ